MKRLATLVIDRKEAFENGSIVQVTVWELPIPLKGSPHRYKYRLYYGRRGECLVRFDNELSIGMKSVPFMGIEKCTTHNQNETS
jgi:hypothetical protein